MKAEEKFINIEGGSLLIIRIVEGKSEHADSLLRESLHRYAYAAKPYAAIVVDISLGGYFISDLDLVSIVMSLPAGAAERTACAVVTRKMDALELQKFLDITKLASLVRVFTSFDEALHAVKIGLASGTPGLPALFVQSSRAERRSPAPTEPITESYPVPEEPASGYRSSSAITRTKVFLAHASEDKEAVRRLYRQLVERGFQPWLDELDLIPGTNWQTAITEAITQCDVFLACLSKSSVAKRGYVQKEFRIALSAYGEWPSGKIYLIPVRLDDCDVPNLQIPELGIRLQDIQWLDLWKIDGFEKLVHAINSASTIPTRQPPTSTTDGVRIVDISFVERIRDQSMLTPVYLEHSGNNVQLELKVRNIGREVAFIKRLKVAVEQLWELEGFGFTGAAVPISAEYDIELPIKSPPFLVDMPIAHSVEPNGVDRLLATIHVERPGYLFLVRPSIVYDEDDKFAASKPVLFATRPNASTWPTASSEILTETDSIAATAQSGTMWDRWPAARKRIESNNRIRDEISRISGLRNRAVASFENGEPLVEGF